MTNFHPLAVAAMLVATFLGASASFAEPPAGLTADNAKQIDQDLKTLSKDIAAFRDVTTTRADHYADVDVFRKGVQWAMRYETKLEVTDVALIQKALKRCAERLDSLESQKPAWETRKGKLVRGFVSAVDGSVQPYGVIVPASYDPSKPIRLDVVLHGSSKPVGMSELRFMSRFDEGDAPPKAAPDANFIELHPLGRVENCYRWAGETDVFEAIEAVRRNYNIDRNRIVLRGMSMGASGTWHLGLKHPDYFVALGPYCGYVDTHEFSHTPIGGFVKVGPLPPHQEKVLHMLDSIDYAANAGVVPVVACMGEKDVFFQAHVLMGKAMEKEGLKMVNLISPGTGHVVDPKTHAEQMRQIKELADKGLDSNPKHIRFVTWTTKYPQCHWLRVERLKEHYVLSELEASILEDGTIDVKEPKNVTQFVVTSKNLKPKLHVGGQEVTLSEQAQRNLVIGWQDGKWVHHNAGAASGKRPGMQGPIDDAFTTRFLCVRGTGKAWNPTVQAWADANLKRFVYEWHRYYRGELRIKDDTAVTDDDIHRHNLIFFGDPGSNQLITRVLPKLPITWTEKEVRFGKDTYPAANHAPVLIQPNPLNERRYVVLNSGHTFHEKELASFNYLQFPRLGDWAVMKVGDKSPANPSDALEEEVIRAGFFDEQWELPAMK